MHPLCNRKAWQSYSFSKILTLNTSSWRMFRKVASVFLMKKSQWYFQFASSYFLSISYIEVMGHYDLFVLVFLKLSVFKCFFIRTRNYKAEFLKWQINMPSPFLEDVLDITKVRIISLPLLLVVLLLSGFLVLNRSESCYCFLSLLSTNLIADSVLEVAVGPHELVYDVNRTVVHPIHRFQWTVSCIRDFKWFCTTLVLVICASRSAFSFCNFDE